MVIYVCVIICKIRTATALVQENWTGNEWELESDSRRNNHTIIVYNSELSLIYINPTYLFMILFSENKYMYSEVIWNGDMGTRADCQKQTVPR